MPTFCYAKFLTEKLKKLYSKHPYMHLLQSTINTSLYLLYHVSSRPYIHPSIHLIFLRISKDVSDVSTPRNLYFTPKPV